MNNVCALLAFLCVCGLVWLIYWELCMTLASKSKRCALYTHWNIRPIETKLHGFRPGRRVSVTETEKKTVV